MGTSHCAHSGTRCNMDCSVEANVSRLPSSPATCNRCFVSKHTLRTNRRHPRKAVRCLSSYTEGYLASLASRLKRQKDNGLLPSLELSNTEAVERQLQVLQENNTPYPDHGVEILYRYSSFDPFERSMYFGRSLDLGQFERFRRIFHTPTYSVLLCHKEHKLVSSLEVSDHRWKQRVEVVGIKPKSKGCFTFTMVQWVGGHFDGIWFCESLISDDPAKIHT